MSRPVKFTLAVLLFAIVALTAAAIATLPSGPGAPGPELQVHFIDVGQGDAILLDYGDTEILIDGGERAASTELVDFLKHHVEGALEVLIATHPHTDHIGALPPVMAAFRVETIWDNGDSATSQSYADYLASARSEGAVMHIGKAGEDIQAGGLELQIISPHSLGNDRNDDSLVLLLVFGEVEFLFMADAGEAVEHALLTSVVLPDIDILKAGHHASRSASSLEFLQAVKPEVVVYSAAAGNNYGHPHPETVERFEQVEAAVYGTDVYGSVTVTSDGKTYSLFFEKGNGSP